MKLNLKKKSSRGFTLVEILLVVGFIAIAGIGVYTVYSKVTASQAANLESRNLDTLRAGVKNLFAGQSNYTNISATVLNNARVTPQAMVSGNNILNSFGGAVTVAAVGLGGGAANGFTITYANVPANVCAKLVTTGGAQFDVVTIGGGTPVKAFGSNALDSIETANQCGATDAAKTLVFSSL